MARKKALQVGATPKFTLLTRIVGEKIRKKPSSTSSAWVAKSITARTMLSLAASLTPTMLTPTSSTTISAPTITSQGFCFRGVQKIDR